MLPNIEKEMKRLEKHLRSKSDEKIIRGYIEAMNDYKITGNIDCKNAAHIIKNEMDRRGIKIEN